MFHVLLSHAICYAQACLNQCSEPLANPHISPMLRIRRGDRHSLLKALLFLLGCWTIQSADGPLVHSIWRGGISHMSE